MVGRTVSHYRVIERIGEGGMGCVYKARDLRLERLVALKFLTRRLLDSDSARARFSREAHAIAALSHPNIAVIYDIDQFEEGPFLALEYLGGGTLGARIRGRQLALEEMLLHARQLAAGLEHAHRHGIVHRDIKPANALFTEDGVLKLVDFGLAKWKGGVHASGHELCGTIAYMAPEQARGNEAEPASDIFSMGAVLYEMAAGRPPFEAASVEGVLRRLLFEEPTSLLSVRPDLPAPFLELVDAALRKDATERIPNAAEFVDRIEIMTGGRMPPLARTPSQETATVAPLTPLSARPRRWKFAGGLAAVALTAAGLWTWVNRGGSAQPAEQRMVVVLPFETESHDGDAGDFCAGIQPRLAGLLVQAEPFRQSYWVPPTSDVRQYQVRTVEEAHNKLGAELVLGGQVVRGPEAYRIVMTLSDAAARRQVDAKIVTVARREADELDDRLLAASLSMLRVSRAPRWLPGTARAAANPRSYDLVVRASGLLRRFGGTDVIERAISLLEEAQGLEGATAWSQALLGEAWLQKFQASRREEHLRRAIEFVEQAERLNPRLDAVRVACAQVLIEAGRNDEAAAKLRQVISADARNYEAWRLVGLAMERAQKPAEAEAAWRNAAAINPGYWPAHANLGAFYAWQGRMAEAEKELRRAAELAPGVVESYRNLGGLYIRMKRYQEAAAQLERALAMEPDYGTYVNLGTLAMRQGRYDSAVAYYERAVAVGSNQIQAWESLGFAYEAIPARKKSARQAYTRALQLAEAGIKRNPAGVGYLSRAALYRAKLGQRAAALALIRRTKALSPEGGATLWALTRAAETAGDRAAALEFARQAFQKGYSLEDAAREPDLRGLAFDPRLQQNTGAHKAQ